MDIVTMRFTLMRDLIARGMSAEDAAPEAAKVMLYVETGVAETPADTLRRVAAELDAG